MDDFASGATDILVATDVLMRGVDLPDVDHVVMFDFPTSSSTYLHRAGRTGRAERMYAAPSCRGCVFFRPCFCLFCRARLECVVVSAERMLLLLLLVRIVPQPSRPPTSHSTPAPPPAVYSTAGQ